METCTIKHQQTHSYNRGEGNQAEGTSRDTRRCISTRFPYHVRCLEIAASSIKHARQGNQVGKRDNPEACAHSFHQLLVTIDKKKRSSGISGIECIPEIVEYIQEQI